MSIKEIFSKKLVFVSIALFFIGLIALSYVIEYPYFFVNIPFVVAYLFLLHEVFYGHKKDF